MIVAISGRKRSGKDTLAKALKEHFGFERVAFADPLKRLTHRVLYRHPGTDGMYEAIRNTKLYQQVMPYPDPPLPTTGRDFWQAVGVAAREEFGEDFWIEQALKKCELKPCSTCGKSYDEHEHRRPHGSSTAMCRCCAGAVARGNVASDAHGSATIDGRRYDGYYSDSSRYAIADLRFQNEFRAIKVRGERIIRLNTLESLKTRHDFWGSDDICHYTYSPQPGGDLVTCCGRPENVHPTSYSADPHISENSLPDDSNAWFKYDSVFYGGLEENTKAAVGAVRFMLAK